MISRREFKPYLAEPLAMASASPGKCGLLRLLFECDSRAVSVLRSLERRAPLIVQQPLYFDEALPTMPCVYILSSGGPIVDGDRYEQHFELLEGAMAHISTGAATKIASMRYNYASMLQSIRLDKGSYLEYLPEPLIPHRSSRFLSQTTILIEASATLFMGEIYLSGRRYHCGERFQYDLLSLETRVETLEGEPLYKERQIIEPRITNFGRVGVMSDYEIFANVLVISPHVAELEAMIEPMIGSDLALGVLSLPDMRGLCVKVLGRSTEQVKRRVRGLCSLVRRVVKGVDLPQEFVWR